MTTAVVVLVMLCSALLGVDGCQHSGSARPGRRPSIALIVVDTLRVDHVGSYSYARPTTPEIDRWARGGVVFERAYSTSSWTLPAFASMLTGLWPRTHGAGIHADDSAKLDIVPLDASLPMLPALLTEAGYRTGAIVNNPILQPKMQLNHGFRDYDYVSSSNSQIRDARQTVDAALAWIDAAAGVDVPFFLLVHIMDPHLNYDPAAAVRGRFTAGYTGPIAAPIQIALRKKDGNAELDRVDRDFVVGLYDEEILFVDGELGRLFARLGELESHLTILTSDHGEEFWDHDDFEHGHTMYDELLRVPLVVVGDGVRPRRVDTAVSTVDIMPTVVESAGLPLPSGLGGVSLLGVLQGHATPTPRPLFAGGILYGADKEAVIDAGMKGILSTDSGRWQLYDLEQNPGETVDLADVPDRGPARIERMHELLDRSSSRSASNAEPVNVIEGLKALGYVDDEGRARGRARDRAQNRGGTAAVHEGQDVQ